jgi:hypothetical protein
MPGTFSFIKIIINYGRFLKMSVTNANVQGKQNFWQLKRMVVMAFFIALSVVGAMLKIPSPTGTVACTCIKGNTTQFLNHGRTNQAILRLNWKPQFVE